MAGEITNERRLGFDPDRPRRPETLARMRAQGMPEAAIRPDRTIDLDVALAAGWHILEGGALAPPEVSAE